MWPWVEDLIDDEMVLVFVKNQELNEKWAGAHTRPLLSST
jgi:hypothetical protein